METRRWLCIDCSEEGRGSLPAACSTCGENAGWYVNARFHDDQRSMAQIMLDQLMGYVGEEACRPFKKGKLISHRLDSGAVTLNRHDPLACR